jgi:hypothetical protein
MPRPLGRGLPLLVLLVSTGFVFAGNAMQQAPSRSSRTAAVSGVVTDGTTGKGVRAVEVALGGSGLPEGPSTLTDSQGRFVFQNLPSSTKYSISAARPGYAGGNSLRRFPVFPRPFAVADGEWIADVRIVLWRLGGISGRVVDEKGEPLVNIPVRVLTRVPVAGTVRWAAGPTVRTDDRGMYRVAGLTRGSYTVNVPSVQSSVPVDTPALTVAGHPPNQSTAFIAPPRVVGIESAGSLVVLDHYAIPPPVSRTAYAIAYYPNTSTLADATPVDLVDSEEKHNIDFVLRPVPTARVSGRVSGPAESQSGLIVRLLPEGAEALGPGSEQATALVGRDGTFTMPRVPAGRYVLEATTTIAEYRLGGSALPAPPGLSASVAFSTSLPWLPGDPLPGELRVYGPRTAGSYSARVPVVVGADDLANVDVALETGGRIAGRVVSDDGSPLPKGLTIQIEPATGDPLLAASRQSGPVNADGTFRIDGLRPGLYVLRAWPPIKSIAAGGDYSTRPIEVRAGSDIGDALVTLTTRVATISGVVSDTKGSIVREGAIILFPVDRSQWTNFGLRPSRIQSMTYFGSQGYQLPRVLAGEYYLLAVDAGVQDAWQDPRFLAAASAVATRVSLDWGATSVQNLTLQQVIVK